MLSAADDGTVRPAALLFGTLSLLVEYLVIAPAQLVVLSRTKDLPVRPAVVFPFGLGIDAGGVRRGMAKLRRQPGKDSTIEKPPASTARWLFADANQGSLQRDEIGV